MHTVYGASWRAHYDFMMNGWLKVGGVWHKLIKGGPPERIGTVECTLAGTRASEAQTATWAQKGGGNPPGASCPIICFRCASNECWLCTGLMRTVPSILNSSSRSAAAEASCSAVHCQNLCRRTVEPRVWGVVPRANKNLSSPNGAFHAYLSGTYSWFFNPMFPWLHPKQRSFCWLHPVEVA